MSVLTIIVISGLIQGGLLWGAIRLLDPANTSNKPLYAVLVGIGLSLLGYSFGLFLLVPLLALGWILLRGYDLGLPRTVGVLVLLGVGNWAVGRLLGMLIESVGLRAVEVMLVAGAGLVLGRWMWSRRGRAGAGASLATPARAVARKGAPAPAPHDPASAPVAARPAAAPPAAAPTAAAPATAPTAAAPASTAPTAAAPAAAPTAAAPASTAPTAAAPASRPSPPAPGDEPTFLR